MDSKRILKQWKKGEKVHINNRLDIKHEETEQWLESRVMETDEKNDQTALIHFTGYHKKFDFWVNLEDKNLVAEVGTYSKAFGQVSCQIEFILIMNERERDTYIHIFLYDFISHIYL